MLQFLLKADGCSGRGVRIRQLSAEDALELQLDAARELGAEAMAMEVHAKAQLFGVHSFVTHVTEETGLKSRDALAKATWKKVTREALAEGLEKYFGPKDVNVLVAMYNRLHHASSKEVDDIMGEALPFTED